MRGGSENSKFSQFQIFPKLGTGGGVVKFQIFPKFKKVQNILGGGGGVKKIMNFSHFLWHLYLYTLHWFFVAVNTNTIVIRTLESASLTLRSKPSINCRTCIFLNVLLFTAILVNIFNVFINLKEAHFHAKHKLRNCFFPRPHFQSRPKHQKYTSGANARVKLHYQVHLGWFASQNNES